MSLLIFEMFFVNWFFAVDIVNATLLREIPGCYLLSIGQRLFVESAVIVLIFFVFFGSFSVRYGFRLKGVILITWGEITAVWYWPLRCWSCWC